MSPLTNPGVGITVELGELNLTANSLLHTNSGGTADAIADVASGQVLTSQGATTVPAWAAPAGIGDFSDGGEAAGADRSLGNTDAFKLQLLTNNLPRIHILSNGRVGIGVPAPTATLQVGSLDATTIAICITEAAGQTAPLFEWRDSTDNLRGFIDAAGSFIVGAAVGGIPHVKIDPDSAITISMRSVSDPCHIKMTATGGAQDVFIGFDTTNADDWSIGLDDSDSQKFKITSAATLGGASTRLTIDRTTGNVGIGTESPQAKLEVGGTPGTSVGGFPSGNLHVTGQSALVNANAVITGHNLFGGNKQLWYLGSTSGSNDAITLINRQNASLSLSTNSATRLTIEAGGDVGIGTTAASAQLHVDQPSTTGAQPVLLLDQADVSEEMIEFASTIGVGNAIEAVGAKTLTVTHFLKCTITGVGTRYIAMGTIA